MSRSGDIELTINSNSNDINALDLLQCFYKDGWSISYDGVISFLPLGDVDYNWTIVSEIKENEVNSILRSKIAADELIGVSLVHKESIRGFLVLFSASFSEIIFSADINRKEIEGTDVTDFSWYLKRIIPVCMHAGLSIEFIDCSHC